MIIDMHNHIGLSFTDGAEGRVEELRSIMKSCRISQSNIFAINSDDVGVTYEKPNDMISKICRKHPKQFFGFCRVQPKSGSKAVKEIERCLKKGLRGIKLHPQSDDFFLEDCHKVFEAASRFKCPVILHTEHHVTRHPRYWEKIFKQYEDVVFILAHAGKDMYLHAGEISRELRNVYLDTSTLSFNRTRTIIEMAGVDKIVFASDYPYSHPLMEIQKIKLIVKDKNSLDKIFYKNAKRILKL